MFAYLYLLARRVVTFKESMDCLANGFISMIPAMLILTFALTLKGLTGALGAAESTSPASWRVRRPELYSMLPAIIFLVALGPGVRHGHELGHLRHPDPHRAAHLRDGSPTF